MTYLSVVIPVYECSEALPELTNRLHNALEKISNDYEIIFVNDASPENDWDLIQQLAKKDERIKGINFSRNFGQHNAITAGLQNVKGEWIVVMDGDLQDQPEEIIKLYQKTKDGFEIVLGQRIERRDSFLKKIFSKLFYKIFGYLTDSDLDSSVSNFGIFNRKVINALLSMKDYIRFFPTMIQWVGFNKYYVPVIHAERKEGKSAYTFLKLLRLAINNMIAFSDKPLRLTTKIGFFISLSSLVLGILYLILYMTGKIQQLGFTSLILSIWFLAGGIIFILGIIGLYVGKTFESVKKRPIYIIKDSLNLEDK